MPLRRGWPGALAQATVRPESAAAVVASVAKTIARVNRRDTGAQGNGKHTPAATAKRRLR